MKKLLVPFLSLAVSVAHAQQVSSRLAAAWTLFERDTQMQSSIASLYVINAKTGAVVFDRNARVGLAPASTQKIITAASAYELLGQEFRYTTVFGLENGRITVAGSGDPTLGSWRYAATADTALFRRLLQAYRTAGYDRPFQLVVRQSAGLPNGGWIFEDLANYYGASAMGLNWRENQYDLNFLPGARVGDPATVDTTTTPARIYRQLENRVRTGAAGSGDNAYINNYRDHKVVTGTIPAGVKRFGIAGSDDRPEEGFADALGRYTVGKSPSLSGAGVELVTGLVDTSDLAKARFVYASPLLDSIAYWFLRRSINLYGEALAKTIDARAGGSGETASGVRRMREFWKSKGIVANELNMVDGSGLSPLNRVTTHAQVEVLRHARQQAWFTGYFAGFPEYNGMKMKSGSISGARGFCGYHQAKDGTEYIFSFIVNNYNGSSSAVVQKMYRVLDVLK